MLQHARPFSQLYAFNNAMIMYDNDSFNNDICQNKGNTLFEKILSFFVLFFNITRLSGGISDSEESVSIFKLTS